jgi:hypothetical protein
MESDETVPGPEAEALTDARLAAYISIWEKVVDTQMHFNEMSVKARQFGLTFVAAALGLGVALMSRDKEPVLLVSTAWIDFELHAVVLLVISSAFALYSVKQLDLKVYHKMLRGAVAFGEDFEENYLKQIFKLEKGMTQAISHYSRYEDAAIANGSRPYKYEGACRKTAFEKVQRFYSFAIWPLVLLAILLFGATGHFVVHHGPPIAAQAPAASAVSPTAPPVPTATEIQRVPNAK